MQSNRNNRLAMTGFCANGGLGIGISAPAAEDERRLFLLEAADVA